MVMMYQPENVVYQYSQTPMPHLVANPQYQSYQPIGTQIGSPTSGIVRNQSDKQSIIMQLYLSQDNPVANAQTGKTKEFGTIKRSESYSSDPNKRFETANLTYSNPLNPAFISGVPEQKTAVTPGRINKMGLPNLNSIE